MTDLIAEVGTKLAERWASALVLPGLLFLAALSAAFTLGHQQAINLPSLADSTFNAYLSISSSPSAMILTAVGLLLGSLIPGLVIMRLGRLVEGLWYFSKPQWLTRKMTYRRRRKWEKLHARTTSGGSESDVAIAVSKRNHYSLGVPALPTWMGDRVSQTVARVRAQYGLDLVFAWPRLWMLVDEETRSEIRGQREQISLAALMAAWGFIYALLGLMWWPGFLIGLILGVTGWMDGRTSTEAFSQIVEATVDLNVIKLAETLGFRVDSGLAPNIGEALSERMRKGA